MLKHILSIPLLLLCSCSMFVVQKSKYDDVVVVASEAPKSKTATVRTYSLFTSSGMTHLGRSEEGEEIVKDYGKWFGDLKVHPIYADSSRYLNSLDGVERMQKQLDLQRKTADSDLYINIYKDEKFDWFLPFKVVYLSLNFLSLGIIPYHAMEEVVLKGEVYNRNGEIIKTAKVSSRVSVTAWLPLIFKKDSHKPNQDLVKKIIRPPMNHLFNKLFSDK